MDEGLQDFLHDLIMHGLERFRVYYGVYRGKVTNNRDPQKRGRVQVLVPEVGLTEALDLWVDPVMLGAGTNCGIFWPPELGDKVWVIFAQGSVRRPLAYLGAWYTAPDGASSVPTELAHTDGDQGVPRRRGLVTRRGHALTFDDTPGHEQVQLTWNRPQGSDDPETTPTRPGDQATFTFLEDGSAKLVDFGGNTITLQQDGGITIEDRNSNKVTLDGSKVEIDAAGHDLTVKTTGTATVEGNRVNVGAGASHGIPLGDLLLQAFNRHQHGSSTGPTTPPTEPLTLSLLSATCQVKG